MREGAVSGKGMHDEAALPLRPARYGATAILVTIIAGAAGASCGALATLPYQLGASRSPHIPVAGPVLGGATGIVAGVIWSRIMVRRARLHPGPLAGRGALLGLRAGIASTAALHLGLSVVAKGLPGLVSEFPGNVILGLFFGIPAGAIVGLCGGGALEAARRRIDRAEPGADLRETGSHP